MNTNLRFPSNPAYEEVCHAVEEQEVIDPPSSSRLNRMKIAPRPKWEYRAELT
jgi:hypothetical protein